MHRELVVWNLAIPIHVLENSLFCEILTRPILSAEIFLWEWLNALYNLHFTYLLTYLLVIVSELDMDWLHPRIRLGWIGLGRILRDILWNGLDWIGLRSRYFNVILIVIALSDCQCVHIFRHSFDVSCCVTNWQLLFTARCTLVQRAVLRSHVVCLSLRPSVRL